LPTARSAFGKPPEVWPTTREQRCWVHKTANVLAKLPKSQQPKAKRALQEIWMAETKADAKAALDAFIESYPLETMERQALAIANCQSVRAL
jgi:transposase-like protein